MTRKKEIDKVEFYKRVIIRFFKYKLIEIGIIPIAIFVPYFLGWCFIWIFHIDPTMNTFFCSAFNEPCDGIHYSRATIWFVGFCVSFVLASFILINWNRARDNVQKEIENERRKER